MQASDAAFNGAVDMATLLQASCRQSRHQGRGEERTGGRVLGQCVAEGRLVTSYWGGRAAATQMLAVAYAAGAVEREPLKNPKFDELLAAARAETDEAKRKPHIWEMQKILHDGGATIVPAFPRLARRPP